MVSIIIPIYNAENHLEECLKSILLQNIDLEVILINDGSTDNSLKICEFFAQLDCRIKLINISNRGPSNARNVGIKFASHEWITFIDADDLVEKNYFNILFDIQDDSVDAIFLDYKLLKGEMVTDSRCVFAENKILSGTSDCIEIQNQIFDSDSFIPYKKNSFTWGKFFRRNVIRYNNLEFPVSISYCEDCIFLYQTIPYLKKIFYAYEHKIPKYIYRLTSSSITNTRDIRVLTQKKAAFDYIVQNIRNDQNKLALNKFFLIQFFSCVNLIKDISKTTDERFNLYHSLYDWQPFRLLNKESIFSFKRYGNLLKTFLKFKLNEIFLH